MKAGKKARARKVIETSLPEKLPLFVYGSLRAGFGNYYNYLSKKTEKELPATLKWANLHSLGSIPGIVRGEGTVIGELMYPTDDVYYNVLQCIDHLEGNGTLYLRTRVVVTLEDGTTCWAWAYYWMSELRGCPRVYSGCWKQYTERKHTSKKQLVRIEFYDSSDVQEVAHHLQSLAWELENSPPTVDFLLRSRSGEKIGKVFIR